jgi:5-methylcytosine-specific restriction enzyme A
VIVATEDSPTGRGVELRRVQEGLDLLLSEGEVRVRPESFGGYRRSSFIGAILATLPETEFVAAPATVRLSAASPLRDALAEGCRLLRAGTAAPNVSRDDPRHQLFSRDLPALLDGLIAGRSGYLTAGSAGRTLWAETPWAAVFDELVTNSAQRGHYVVLLFHPLGECVDLSLILAVTEARSAEGGYLALLKERADEFRRRLRGASVSDLNLGPLSLNGRGARTRGYEAGNVVNLRFDSEDLPHDAVLSWHIQRFLRLYSLATETTAPEALPGPDERPPGDEGKVERRRWRWHLLAEGRNSSLARRAKELKNYTCDVCGIRYADELGELGKRCVDAHHLVPFEQLDERPTRLDPREDFAVVCSNCHRMLHSERPPLTPETLAAILSNGSDGTRTRDLRRDRPAL